MKRTVKKFLCLFLTLALIMVSSVSAAAVEAEVVNARLAVQKNSACVDIITDFRMNMWDKFGGQVYPDEYAGAYIDNNNNLIICYTAGNLKALSGFYSAEKTTQITAERLSTFTASVREETVQQLVSFAEVKYSYNYLFELNDTMVDYFAEFGICSSALCEIENKVEVQLNDISLKASLEARLQADGIPLDAVNIVSVASAINADKNAYPGDAIWYTTGFLGLGGKHTGTIGFNAVYNGVAGVVTNGHVAESGKNMKVSAGTLGTPTFSTCANNGKVDVAFIPFPGSSWTSSGEIKQDGYTMPAGYDGAIYSYLDAAVSSASLVVGAKIYKYGNTTGKTLGSLISTSINITVNYGTDDEPDRRVIKDCIEYSNARQGGDSGGPVGTYIADSWGRCRVNLAGLHFAGGDTGFACKLSNILSQYPALQPVYE